MIEASTLDFLKELKTNNNKSWFDANRKTYEKVKANYLSCAGTILTAMKEHDHSLDVLTPKDCIFRINRDIRFSPDKSPYKTNLGIALFPMGKKSNLAAYYLHIEPGASFIGGGLWMPQGPPLTKVRKEIHYFYNDLRQILDNSKFNKMYGDLDVEEGQKLVRPPKGYEAENPAIEYLKLKSFTAAYKIQDRQLTNEKMVDTVVESFKVIQPLLQFINRGLLSDEEGGL